MITIKQEYRQYLEDNFKGQKIQIPLFFNENFGLRFDLQKGETGTEEYFAEVARRSTLLFEAAFDTTDKLFMVFINYKWKRRKIRFSNYYFKQIADIRKNDIDYSVIRNFYSNSKDDVHNVALLKIETIKVSYKNIFAAFANDEFPPRQPRFTRQFSEVYFINITKHLVFNMYDDQGLDIIASEAETLKPIYTKFNDWILEANREKIDKLMSVNT